MLCRWLCLSVCLSQIAKDTHGFVGADLSQLCMEAALRCIREQMHTIDVDADKIPVVSGAELPRVNDVFDVAVVEGPRTNTFVLECPRFNLAASFWLVGRPSA